MTILPRFLGAAYFRSCGCRGGKGERIGPGAYRGTKADKVARYITNGAEEKPRNIGIVQTAEKNLSSHIRICREVFIGTGTAGAGDGDAMESTHLGMLANDLHSHLLTP